MSAGGAERYVRSLKFSDQSFEIKYENVARSPMVPMGNLCREAIRTHACRVERPRLSTPEPYAEREAA